MKNKTIANWLIAVLGLSVWGSMIEAGDDYFTVVGLGFIVFGIMAIVRLYKIND